MPGQSGLYETQSISEHSSSRKAGSHLRSRSGLPARFAFERDLESTFDRIQSRVSPDSRYLAYTTNESGTFQIVVQTFPDPNGGKWQISAEGGVQPKWRRDGRELYYLSLDGKIMSVPVSTGAAFTAGRPMTLFQTPLTVNRRSPTRDRQYDVAPDGRFLISVPAASAAYIPFTVTVNWDAVLEK